MSHIPDDFDDLDPDHFQGYVRINSSLPGAPIYTPVRKSPRVEPRKFNPQYRKAGEAPTKRKTPQFNQQTFWQAVSYIGMGGLMVMLAFLVSFLIHKSS